MFSGALSFHCSLLHHDSHRVFFGYRPKLLPHFDLVLPATADDGPGPLRHKVCPPDCLGSLLDFLEFSVPQSQKTDSASQQCCFVPSSRFALPYFLTQPFPAHIQPAQLWHDFSLARRYPRIDPTIPTPLIGELGSSETALRNLVRGATPPSTPSVGRRAPPLPFHAFLDPTATVMLLGHLQSMLV